MFLCFLYCIPIICIKRFHHRIYIFTSNICLIILCFGIIHIIYLTTLFYCEGIIFTNFTCKLIIYLRVMITFQLAFAFLMVSIYRFAYVIYHSKRFFKTKKWFLICFASQWLIGFLLPLVSLLAKNDSKCHYSQWVSIYMMIVIVVLCPIITLVVNIRIFHFGHTSFRRLQSHHMSNRIEPISRIVSNRTNPIIQTRSRINRRDIRQLKHTIYMFLMFLIGWGPIYTLKIFMHNANVSTSLLGFFFVWAQLSLVCLVINMFVFNQELRKYLTKKIFLGF
ncbi:hypothetical protein I4U23_020092 [Adineta vaga]|nr:hypothetical protein I4U23_020092 [Adineta vaga]